jgi:inosine-uridine nucleoside N-ribohydrolase
MVTRTVGVVWAVFLGAGTTALADVGVAALAGRPPVRVIFDCDMDSDCDDAGALGLLHALADLGEAEILAVMISALDPNAAPCADAINTYYGRGDLPIGTARRPAPDQKSKYTKAVADRCPHDLKASADAPDAVELYRRILEAEKDGAVTLVTVGDMTNLAKLLRVPAEGERPSGVDLVKRKVKLWVCMGGNFIGKPAKDDLKLGNNNFTLDPKATFAAITGWPTPIVFAGREVCSVPSGLNAGARLAETPKENPVRIAYEAYFGEAVKDRHVADQATVLFAVRGLRDYWDAEGRGGMDLREDMTFDWRYDRDRRQAYLLKRGGPANDRRVEKVIEDLMVRPAGK